MYCIGFFSNFLSMNCRVLRMRVPRTGRDERNGCLCFTFVSEGSRRTFPLKLPFLQLLVRGITLLLDTRKD